MLRLCSVFCSKCSRSLLLWRIVLIFLIFYFIYLIYGIGDGKTKKSDRQKYLQSNVYANIENFEFYIYSAIVSVIHSSLEFLDVRLAVLDGENFNGFYCCFKSDSENTIYQTKSKIKSTFQYKTYHFTAKQFSCLVPQQFQAKEVYFGFTCEDTISKSLKIYFPPIRRNETAFCTKTAFGNVSTQSLVEYIELHRALGVSKILVHDLNLNSRIKNILSWYHESGLVDVMSMEFPGNVSEERQRVRDKLPLYADAQIAVYDCVERLSGYGFIGIVDLDEILAPSKTTSIPALLKDLLLSRENAGSFVFGVEQFIKDWNISNNSTLESMKYIQRMEPDYIRPKVVHIPGRVGMVWTHDAAPVWGFKKYRVPMSVATIHHYRACRKNTVEREKCSNSPRFSDARLLSLEDAIRNRVEKILKIFTGSNS